MERQTQVNIRLHLEEKAAILKRAKEEKLSLSDFMRRAALKGLVPKTADGIAREAFDAPDVQSDVAKHFHDATLTQLVTKLKAQGMTTPVATREAKKRLGL